MILNAKQGRFAIAIARLIVKATEEKDLIVQIRECLRSKETADLYAKEGKGVRNSTHLVSLAADLGLFDAATGQEVPRETYETLGEWWIAQSTVDDVHCWGGCFKDIDDIYHFSFEYNGVR